MFIGHYGPALAAKPMQKRVPLWLLFVAVQWMDFWWSAFILLGVEKARIVLGFTEGSALDLYFMPYTHGLLTAAALALVSGILVSLAFKDKAVTIAVVAGAVFSHWLLDLVVHVPDLPLIGDDMKVGLGLWRHVALSLLLELVLLVVGALIYDLTTPTRPRGRIALWLFVAATAAVQVYVNYGPPPPTVAAEAVTALIAYTVLALLAAGVEALRK